MHWGVPSTIEEYIQETGRAGRDGEYAEAILYEGKVSKNCTKIIKAMYQTRIFAEQNLFLVIFCVIMKGICV